MHITQATLKGQIVIPVSLRKKYHIQKGSRLAVIDREGEIVIKPLVKDPIAYGHGILKGGKSALKELLTQRKLDVERYEK